MKEVQKGEAPNGRAHKERLRIGSRRSALALWQAEYIRQAIQTHYPQIFVEIVEIATTGDQRLDVALQKIGGKGLFLKELEEALLAGSIDLAVHSLKDVPAVLSEEFALSAICKRESPFDVAVCRNAARLEDLPTGARVGTSSLRRAIQLGAAYPNLEFAFLRGNVKTRLQKLDQGEYQAIILAEVGLQRLGLAERISQVFAPSVCVPAVGQGALAIEVLRENEALQEQLRFLDHEPTRSLISGERTFLRIMGGSCSLPIGAYAHYIGDEKDSGDIRLHTFYANEDGSVRFKETLQGCDSQQLGQTLGECIQHKSLQSP